MKYGVVKLVPYNNELAKVPVTHMWVDSLGKRGWEWDYSIEKFMVFDTEKRQIRFIKSSLERELGQ